MSAAIQVEIVATGQGRPPGWNTFSPAQAHPANCTEYADFYATLGHTPVFLEARHGGEKLAQWLVCRRPRRFNPLGALYAECAPQLTQAALDSRDDVFVACFALLRRRFLLQEFVLLKHALVRGVSQAALRRSGFRRIVELRSHVASLGTDEDLLAAFHSSHRNDTRKALREGFRYTPELSAADFNALAAEMKAESGYAGPEPAVVEAIERTLVHGVRAFLSGVHVHGRLVAASIVLHAGEVAFYLYGASLRDKARGATTLLQYENMRRLRALGVLRYDFGGAGVADETNPKASSIARFKERFGGTLVSSFAGSYR